MIFFLTCDAFGVLPPIARLNIQQAEDFFLAGYTSKVSGTEIGITEPKATFSTCFGQAFLLLALSYYAGLFTKYMKQSSCEVWLVNTGWTGGGYRKGQRIKLAYTRSMIRAILKGRIDNGLLKKYGRFELMVPRPCPAIPESLLDSRAQWDDRTAYEQVEADLFSLSNEAASKHSGRQTKHDSNTARTKESTICL